MDWDDIRYLLAIYRAENMVSAALHLGVNQSTVSRRLRDVEAKIGERLFYRSGAALLPTERLIRLLPDAERMEQAYMALQSGTRAYEDGARLVRINAMPWVVNHLLLPALPTFLAGCPDVSVEAIASVRDRNRLIGEADLSLRFELMPKSRELCEPVAQISYAVYGPKGPAVETLPWIGFGGDFDGFAPARWIQQRARYQAVRVNDAGSMLLALEQGLGIGLLPDVLAARSERLQRITKKKGPEITRTLRVMVHADVARQRHVAGAIDWLYETMSQNGLSVSGPGRSAASAFRNALAAGR